MYFEFSDYIMMQWPYLIIIISVHLTGSIVVLIPVVGNPFKKYMHLYGNQNIPQTNPVEG